MLALRWKGKEMFYLMTHSMVIYGYMASDILYRSTQIMREGRKFVFNDTHNTFFNSYMVSDIW